MEPEIGRKEGQEVGRKELKTEIIKNMRSKGFSLQEICKITGLTEKEIKKL